MCGIVAAVADRNIVPILIEGLRKLEYRGYDSAGLAVHNGGMHRLRAVGRVSELASRAEGLTAGTGIAHTRWATHGVPSERNAHPHVSGGLAVVHNGIIENYTEIKARLAGSCLAHGRGLPGHFKQAGSQHPQLPSLQFEPDLAGGRNHGRPGRLRREGSREGQREQPAKGRAREAKGSG